MKHLIALLPLLFACSSAPGDEPRMRIDGSPEADGFFVDEYERADFCAEQPEHALCAELGTASQPWVSAEYAGQAEGTTSTNSKTCYGSMSAGGSCLFPALKQVKIQFDVSNCYDVQPNPADPTPSLVQANQAIAAFKAGALAWNGNGSGVTVQDGTCSNAAGVGCLVVTMGCSNFTGTVAAGSYAYTVQSGYSTRVANLPVGPHGVDQVKAEVYTNVGTQLDILYAWRNMKNSCGLNPPTSGQLNTLFKAIGKHEMGHALGFNHFLKTGQIMTPGIGCFPSVADMSATQFGPALGIYNSSGGAVTISDVNLEDQLPQ